MISFRIDWFDLLAIQRTLKSLLQTTLQKHQFSGAQLSLCPTLTSICDYWENHSFGYMDLCQQSNVSRIAYACRKVILSMFVIAFLPRSRCLLISWLQSLFVMILEGSQENPGGQVKIPFNEEKQLAVSYVAYC